MSEIQEGGSKSGKHGGKVRGKKQSTKIDMTPMVDLAFLLLTFFIMTTTFAKPKVMQINMPKEADPNDPKPAEVVASKTLTLLLHADDKVLWYMGSADTSGIYEVDYQGGQGGLRNLLQQKKAILSTGLTVLIKNTTEANYKNLVDVLDEINIVGVTKYAIVKIDGKDLKKIPNP